jgi:hypothetical protein
MLSTKLHDHAMTAQWQAVDSPCRTSRCMCGLGMHAAGPNVFPEAVKYKATACQTIKRLLTTILRDWCFCDRASEDITVPFLQLPDECLVAVLRCLETDQRSLFSTAQTHSRLQRMSHIALTNVQLPSLRAPQQQHLDSLVPYLSCYGQHVSSMLVQGRPCDVTIGCRTHQQRCCCVSFQPACSCTVCA